MLCLSSLLNTSLLPARPPAVFAQMSLLDRLLPALVVAAMVLGVLLGYYVPKVRTGVTASVTTGDHELGSL